VAPLCGRKKLGVRKASEPRSDRSGTTASERPSATSHNYTAFSRTLIIIVSSFPHCAACLIASRSSSVQRKTTTSESKTFQASQPPFHRRRLSLPTFVWTVTIGSSRKGPAQRYPSYSVFGVFSSILTIFLFFFKKNLDTTLCLTASFARRGGSSDHQIRTKCVSLFFPLLCASRLGHFV
jgi:hypothetical protein